MGLVRITSWYPNFIGSHFGLPPSEINRMTGLPPKIVWIMTYSHRPHFTWSSYHTHILQGPRSVPLQTPVPAPLQPLLPNVWSAYRQASMARTIQRAEWTPENTKMEHRTRAWVLVINERAWFFSVHLDSMQRGKIDVLRKGLFHCGRLASRGVKQENSADEPCFNVWRHFSQSVLHVKWPARNLSNTRPFPEHSSSIATFSAGRAWLEARSRRTPMAVVTMATRVRAIASRTLKNSGTPVASSRFPTPFAALVKTAAVATDSTKSVYPLPAQPA